jgi:hypothetical protein
MGAWDRERDLRELLPHPAANPPPHGGQRYRLIARINYRTRKAFVLHILTHSDYDKGKWKK